MTDITLPRAELQQVLEALEEINKLSIGENAICLPAEIDGAMDALRERMAQPEQEPVAWRTKNATPPGGYVIFQQYPQAVADLGGEIEPLYTAPPQRQWVELSDKEVRNLIPPADVWKYEVGHDEAIKLIRSALALAKEKNT